ncbi:MAG: hypothetical protein M0009_16805 [Deltaproteobacteria bacterium]|nr:hypothetical protein [Deltaproteobacteria bacterium]
MGRDAGKAIAKKNRNSFLIGDNFCPDRIIYGKRKKFWFLKLSGRIWIPISWEGWLTAFVLVFALLLIGTQSWIYYREAFSLARHWPILLELSITLIAFYWLSHGHVKKRN